MNTAPTTARKGYNKPAARKDTAPAPRQTPTFSRGGAIQGEIQNAVLALTPTAFVAWLNANFDGIDIRHQQIAKTMLSTFIEESLKIRHGVYFADPDTVQVGWVNTSFMKIDASEWMTGFIMAFPKANWNLKVSA